MTQTLYFYDLETSGVSPKTARIMQFAGQRTDMKLRPLGEPQNFLIRLSDDVLPEPDAILITGITPQQTQAEGLSEAEFLKAFYKEVVQPETIFLGYNTVRFDDEFMRYLHWRNFYDPYEWQWKDGRSRWDLLDAVRMTRALRPDGIKWPVDSTGKSTNRLELLTSLNGLDHANAHDALSDVQASIALAALLRGKQPKLFDYLLEMRDKKQVEQLVKSGQPFVYSSGKYAGEFEKTTVAVYIGEHPQRGALVYDLRQDPTKFAAMSPEQLVEAWRWLPRPKPGAPPNPPRLPVKTLAYNRCPAVAPLSVLDKASQQRLQLDLPSLAVHQQKLAAIGDWPNRLHKALEIMNKQRQSAMFADEQDVDGQLYDGFCSDTDRQHCVALRSAAPADIMALAGRFGDERLKALGLLYKARNFPAALTDEERQAWDTFRQRRLLAGGENSRLARFFKRIEELSALTGLTQNQRYLLEDLRLYGESLLPSS
jgi:exodeoxyribonuclease-1